MALHWFQLGLLTGLACLLTLAGFAARRRWTWPAMGVALANGVFVLLHLMAPFRGVMDAGYAGYRAGLIRMAPGPLLSVVTGGIAAAALACACLALRARPGPGMAFIAVVDGALLLVIGLPELLAGLATPEDHAIALGGSWQVPGLATVLVTGALVCLPLVLSIVWSARRTRPVLLTC